MALARPAALVCAALALAACVRDAAIAKHAEPPAAASVPSAPTPSATPAGDAGVRPSEPKADAPRGAPGTDSLLPPLAAPTPIEDPSGVALAAFHAALARAAAGEGQARVVFYGGSHVAADVYTDWIRAQLQARFGDAGIGFVLPAKPWRWHRHARIEYEESRAFTPVRVKASQPLDGIYGLAGVAFDASSRQSARAAIRIPATPRIADAPEVPVRFDLYYLEQPKGGRLSVFVDGERVTTLGTAAPEWRAGYASFETTDAEHHLELRTHADGPVRVFGFTVERVAPGVVVDTLGIPGARARYHLHWDETVQNEHLERRMPALVVLAYGTNESGDDDVPIEAEEARIDAVVKRIRAAAPGASCLLVGPSDRPLASPDGGYEPRLRTELLIDAQRRVSIANGCGYFDVVAFMGGPLSMLRWVAAIEPLGKDDLVHFTRAGYERLGAVLHDALLSGYVADDPQTPRAAP